MGRFVFGIVSVGLLVAAAYVWTEVPQMREKLQVHLPAQEVMAFEAKYSPELVVQRYQRQVSDKGSSYEDPQIELYPYLMMDVKYVKNGKSYEGKLLWSLGDGEIVLNTQNWTSTHGYDDCLMAHANEQEMRVIHALADHGGQLDRTGLLESLRQDSSKVDEWLESSRKKQLITQNGNYWKLHMQQPLFCLEPLTSLKDAFVQRPVNGSRIMSGRYRPSQIIELAKSAFGRDFAIKRTQEVYLPVYNLTFKYGDGSKRTMRFNAYSNTLFL